MAAVAARAGTNKATLYRRWPNRTELLAATINGRVARLLRDPVDTGNLRDDVIAVLQVMVQWSRAAQLVPDPGGELAGYLLREAVADGLEQIQVVVDRAVQRGELQGSPPQSTIRLPINVLHSELRLDATRVSDELIQEIVDGLFLALVHLTTTPRPAHSQSLSPDR
jgi:AcrR family transcriptional regulator